jgi:TFIIF-interacting CTD phosphatase-like protein
MKKSERDIEKHGQYKCCGISNKAPNLDIIITKNQKKLEIHIYTILILYVTKIIKHRQRVKKILYKLRYIKAVMCEQINSIYWLKKLIFAG